MTYQKMKNKTSGQLNTLFSIIKLRINKKNAKKNEAFILIKKRKKMKKNYYYLSKNKNLKEAAKNLYKHLRNIKKKIIKVLLLKKFLIKDLVK